MLILYHTSGNILLHILYVHIRVAYSEYHYIQEELCEKFGTKVKIKNNKIEINFVNSNDLNRILEVMGIIPRN